MVGQQETMTLAAESQGAKRELEVTSRGSLSSKAQSEGDHSDVRD
jgi:hypothetical protein